VIILVFPKSFRKMERKRNTQHLPDWQPCRHPFPEFDFYQDNERSEDDENSFYSFAGTDSKETDKEKKD
jgi:hypothetical protein